MKQEPVRFTVPGVPVPKGRPRVGRSGGHTPARTRRHERLIWVAAKQARVRPMTGPICLTARFYLPEIESADVDNLAKTVLDALNGWAYPDDKHVVSLVALKYQDGGKPRTEVEIGPA